ncbi:hypothetical protein F5883DRAFT_539103 [Diaporthe sp. PMI_573]|jgi:hypothetical protein|nr:hypothetical protein F5883DRAFT_539103 [Diaporthaceae sp. PMI_573]
MRHRFATACENALLCCSTVRVWHSCSVSICELASCCELLPQLSTSVDHRHILVPVGTAREHSEHDGEAIAYDDTRQTDLQLPFIPSHSAPVQPGPHRIWPSAAPSITPRPRRRRHGLGYKQLVAAAGPAGAADTPSPGPGLACYHRAIVGESHSGRVFY